MWHSDPVKGAFDLQANQLNVTTRRTETQSGFAPFILLRNSKQGTSEIFDALIDVGEKIYYQCRRCCPISGSFSAWLLPSLEKGCCRRI